MKCFIPSLKLSIFTFILAFIGSLFLIASCKKYSDVPGKSDPRLSRKYCNDPDAVNYNRDFPGTADNSVCFYAADVFAGTYSFVDSIYDGGNKFQKEDSLTLTIKAVDHNHFTLAGFCASNASQSFTTNRSLLATVDTTALNGQILCRPMDTLSGTISQSLTDNTRITFYLTVVADTGTTFHQGTAFRQ